MGQKWGLVRCNMRTAKSRLTLRVSSEKRLGKVKHLLHVFQSLTRGRLHTRASSSRQGLFPHIPLVGPPLKLGLAFRAWVTKLQPTLPPLFSIAGAFSFRTPCLSSLHSLVISGPNPALFPEDSHLPQSVPLATHTMSSAWPIRW